MGACKRDRRRVPRNLPVASRAVRVVVDRADARVLVRAAREADYVGPAAAVEVARADGPAAGGLRVGAFEGAAVADAGADGVRGPEAERLVGGQRVARGAERDAAAARGVAEDAQAGGVVADLRSGAVVGVVAILGDLVSVLLLHDYRDG